MVEISNVQFFFAHSYCHSLKNNDSHSLESKERQNEKKMNERKRKKGRMTERNTERIKGG